MTLFMREQLQRVGDMAGPDILQRARPDEVFHALPAPELRHVEIECGGCFT